MSEAEIDDGMVPASPIKTNWITWVGRSAAFMVLLSATAGAYWVSSAPRRTAAASTLLTVATEKLDIGNVWEDSNFVWNLPIESKSKKNIEVMDFVSSCPSVSFEPRSLVLSPRGKAEVSLRIDLSRVSGGCGVLVQGADADLRDFAIRILPLLGEGWPSQTPWILRGRVRRAFTLSKQLLHFDDSLVQGNPFKSRTLALIARAELKSVEAQCDPSQAAAEVSAMEDYYLLTVTPNASLPPGPFDFELIVQATIQDGRRLTGKVRVMGQVLADIYFLPDVVGLGARPMGETVEEIVVLQSRSGQPFEVVGLEAKPEDVAVEALGKLADYGWKYRVSQKITGTGDQASVLRFRVNRASALNQDEVRLVVSYRGMPTQPSVLGESGSH